MKKILIVTIHPLYPVSHGGIVRVIEEAKFLSKNGFEVHLVGNFTKRKYLEKVENITGAKAYTYSIFSYLTSGILSEFSFFVPGWVDNSFIGNDVRKFAKKIKPDIIQAEFLHAANQVSKVSKELNIPFVLSEHNTEYIKLSMEKRGNIEDLKIIEKNICNSADYISTVSDNDKEELRKIGVNVPIITIPNGVDFARYQVNAESRETLRQKYGLTKDDTVIVFHGTLNYFPNSEANDLLKNRIFPELLKIHKNLKLLLMGPGHKIFMDENIIELAEISFEEFPVYLSMGDIAVVPLTTGSGTRLKIIEYMASGIPTVSTEIGAEGLPVEDGTHILISQDTGRNMIHRISTLIEDRRLQQKLIQNGRKIVQEKLDWNIVLKKYLNIYNTLI